jgi:hypothetical protein
MCACVKADADILRRCRLGARQKFGLSYVVHRAVNGSHYLADLIKKDFKAIVKEEGGKDFLMKVLYMLLNTNRTLSYVQLLKTPWHRMNRKRDRKPCNKFPVTSFIGSMGKRTPKSKQLPLLQKVQIDAAAETLQALLYAIPVFKP